MSYPPLTPSNCVIQGERFLPVDVSFWRDGELALAATADAFRSGMLLSFASWQQTPCASVPNDDAALAVLAGLGRTKRALSQWLRLKSDVMKDWVLCSDNRWYHPKISEQAIVVWQRLEQERKQRERSAHRTSKTRDEARKIRSALRGIGVPTSSLQSLQELRSLALAHGLVQFQPVLSVVPAVDHQASSGGVLVSSAAMHQLGTGTHGASITYAPVPTTAPSMQPRPQGEVGTLDLFEAGSSTSSHLSRAGRKRDECPSINYDSFVAAYHEEMPSNPRMVVLSDKRRKAIRNVWKESSQLSVAPFRSFKTLDAGIAAWRKFFQVCNAASFLRGEGPANALGRRFCPSLDFFLKIDNVIKAVEGKYHADGE